MKLIALNEELSEWELKQIPNGVDVFIYDYSSGSYEGSGNALFRKNGKWFLHNMGHCSCYGPTENIDSCGHGETLKQMKLSKEYAEQTKELFKRASKFK